MERKGTTMETRSLETPTLPETISLTEAPEKASPPRDWQKIHPVMEARLRALLAKHQPTAPLTGVGLESMTARNRIRTLALVASGLVILPARGWDHDRILEAVKSGYEGEKATAADARAMERGKMLLIRLVWHGCKQRGELR